MLGLYENFPRVVHYAARFACGSSLKRVQRAIIDALHGLNQESYPLNSVSPSNPSDCTVSFEFGVAEGFTFNYLDREERKRLRGVIGKNPVPVLDFLCVIRYHVLKGGRTVPLRFDYQLLRFAFTEGGFVLQLFHERGTRRVPLEELASFIVERISKVATRGKLRPLKLEGLGTL